jgi:midasin
MNPANDAGKRDLPPALRARFTEIWVDEPNDPGDLACIVSGCLSHVPAVLPDGGSRDDFVASIVQCYTGARSLAAPLTGAALRDGSGGRPHFSVRRQGWLTILAH